MTIPPNNLVHFKHTDQYGATDKVEIEFLDPTFGDLEDLLLGADENARGLFRYRWGYPGQGLEEANWHEMMINDFNSAISTSGIRINLTGFSAVIPTSIVAVEPKVYTGKVSSVARQVAKDMGFTNPDKIFIEETDDDERGTGPEDTSVIPAPWPTGNLTLVDFLHYLMKEAKSKANPNGTYNFRFGSDKSFHFHTDLYQTSFGYRQIKAKRTFDVLFGMTDVGIEFVPVYRSQTMGSRSRSILAQTYDPRTKQFVEKVLDRDSMGLTTDMDSVNAKTTAPPFTKSADGTVKITNGVIFYPTKQVAMGGRCSGKQAHQHTGPAEALKISENAFKRMQAFVSGGTLTLKGRPEVANLSLDEIWTEIRVIRKNKSLHWSSGWYRLYEVVHDIGSSYTVTATLARTTQALGPSDAATGKAAANKIVVVPTK